MAFNLLNINVITINNLLLICNNFSDIILEAKMFIYSFISFFFKLRNVSFVSNSALTLGNGRSSQLHYLLSRYMLSFLFREQSIFGSNRIVVL